MRTGSDCVGNKRETVGAWTILKATVEKALQVAEQVHRETKVGNLALSFAEAVLESVRQVFGSLEGRKLLLLGTGKTAEQADGG